MGTWFARRSVRDLRPGDHAWLAFADHQEQEHVAGAFVYEGLAAAEKVVYVTDAVPRELPGMLTRYRRVLGCEGRMDAAIAPSTLAIAICQVGRGCCTARRLAALRNQHEVLVEANPEFDDGVLRITRTFEPTGLRLEGELDGARHAVFAETLSSLAAHDCDVHLDLSGLRFIDLGALNVMTVFANRPRNGGRLLLDHLAPELEIIIDMVGWHRLPGLTRGEGQGHGQGARS
jgi:anti-anti-sigma factor